MIFALTDVLAQRLLSWHEQLGNGVFLAVTLLICGIVCFWGMPRTTDWMVNAGAGLAGHYFGHQQRAMVINSTTNSPELFTMVISLLILRLGGIGNPLGSNFSNIYLMFVVAPVLVIVGWLLGKRRDKIPGLLDLCRAEKKLICWHLLMSVFLFLAASVAYFCLVGRDQFNILPGETGVPSASRLGGAVAIAIFGLVVFVWRDRLLKRARPEIFDEISDDDHSASWPLFLVGMTGLVICSYVINSVFVAWSQVYSAFLTGVLGAAVFAALHYFVGSIVTSLPELFVATKNIARLRPADLNTALGSASYSNLSNLVIAALGAIAAIIATGFGVRFVL